MTFLIWYAVAVPVSAYQKFYRCNGQLRRLYNSASSEVLNRKKIAFLGTPQCAGTVLQLLYNHSIIKNSLYEIAAVVTQPPNSFGSSKKKIKSPVQLLAESLHLSCLSPATAKDETFLSHLESQSIDLCITAAYGNYLPKRFLSIPRFGTINLHPSLLPKYRGAAPVQRCLDNGDSKTGISLLYSVAKMDAGPLLSQIDFPLNGMEKAPDLTDQLFVLGTHKLIELFPKIFSGDISPSKADSVQIQDETKVSFAPKLSMDESTIDLGNFTAREVYNKWRAFYGWPELHSFFQMKKLYKLDSLVSTTSSEVSEVIDHDEISDFSRIKLTSLIEIPLITMQQQYPSVLKEFQQQSRNSSRKVVFTKYHENPSKDFVGILQCKEQTSFLGILSVQPDGKKTMDARSFYNGYKGKLEMRWLTKEEMEKKMAKQKSI
jgi:methionyl-tRNA formyltransferase